ncbi:MAG: glycine cleavage system aminomethyltransferase GcvT [Hyphomicrobiales bacterium]
MSETSENLQQTSLHDLHVELGGKMVGFAGYSMPVQYPAGIVTEHNHTRSKAGLFDVSHMGQVLLKGESHAHVSAELEKLVPGDIAALDIGRTRYTQFTNQEGGILDDLMVTRTKDDGTLYLVVNASRKDDDHELMVAGLGDAVEIERIEDRSLIALQGPAAERVLSDLADGIEDMAFMSSEIISIDGIECWVSRSGYTGEDGFEISVRDDEAVSLAQKLLANDDVLACGLGARDSLRLEGGLCLYGNDIDDTTSPIEAGLIWSISKRRRAEGGFPGADRIQLEIVKGASRKRVGIKPDGRAPARDGVEIQDTSGNAIGTITSGGFGPSITAPIAMGYVPTDHAAIGTKLNLIVRGKALPATVVALPFVPNNFKR